jgi:hypothetical protein
MKYLVCDVCKKEIDKPVAEWNYFHIKTWDICEQCKNELESAIFLTVRGKKPFSYEWYERLMCDSIEKACTKSKF